MIKLENKNIIVSDFFENNSCPDIQAHILSFINDPRDKAFLCYVSKKFKGVVENMQELAWTIAGQVKEEELEQWVGTRIFTNYKGCLNLSKSGLTNRKLQKCVSAFPNLTKLDLSDSLNLTSNGLKLLQNLPHLKSLDLSKGSALSTQGLGYLRYVNKLEELNLSDMNWVDDESLVKVFTHCTNLKKLSVNNCKNITNELFVQNKEKNKKSQISQVISNLEFLSLYGCSRLKQIEFVHKMALKHLDLTNCLLRNIDFIKECNQLEHLILSMTLITDVSLIALHLTKLKSLALMGCAIDNHEPFSHLTTLEYFVPPNTFSNSLKYLSDKLVKLKEILFYYSYIKSDNIVDLSKMSQLQSILLPSRQMFNSEDLKPLSSLKSLEKITAKIQDPSKVHAILPQLRELKFPDISDPS